MAREGYHGSLMAASVFTAMLFLAELVRLRDHGDHGDPHDRERRIAGTILVAQMMSCSARLPFCGDDAVLCPWHVVGKGGIML